MKIFFKKNSRKHNPFSVWVHPHLRQTNAFKIQNLSMCNNVTAHRYQIGLVNRKGKSPLNVHSALCMGKLSILKDRGYLLLPFTFSLRSTIGTSGKFYLLSFNWFVSLLMSVGVIMKSLNFVSVLFSMTETHVKSSTVNTFPILSVRVLVVSLNFVLDYIFQKGLRILFYVVNKWFYVHLFGDVYFPGCIVSCFFIILPIFSWFTVSLFFP